jgi:hypothetical protein
MSHFSELAIIEQNFLKDVVHFTASACSGAGVFEIVPRAQALLDEFLNKFSCPADRGDGCSTCCKTPLPVHELEVFWLAKIIGRENIQLLRDHRGRVCPLLRDGKCSCYENRPSICRCFFSSNVVSCSTDEVAAYVLPLKIRAVIWETIDKILGLRGFRYSMVPSVLRAMESKSRGRWLKRLPIFDGYILVDGRFPSIEHKEEAG